MRAVSHSLWRPQINKHPRTPTPTMGQQGQQGCLGELKKRIDKPPLIDDTSMLLEFSA